MKSSALYKEAIFIDTHEDSIHAFFAETQVTSIKKQLETVNANSFIDNVVNF